MSFHRFVLIEVDAESAEAGMAVALSGAHRPPAGAQAGHGSAMTAARPKRWLRRIAGGRASCGPIAVPELTAEITRIKEKCNRFLMEFTVFGLLADIKGILYQHPTQEPCNRLLSMVS
jgi:hypothetical protein